jgi:hypothetical protein
MAIKFNDRAELSGLNRNFKLTMTDIERLRYFRKLIDAAEKRLAIIEQNPENNINEFDAERAILRVIKQTADEIESQILHNEINQCSHR